MRTKISMANILKLNVSQRIQLVEDVWDSIASVPEAMLLTDQQKKSSTDASPPIIIILPQVLPGKKLKNGFGHKD